ncbi:MAG: zinc ABC transporter permease AztB [Mesorhizobium sp.]
MNPYDLLIAPFAEFGFMQRALAGVVLLSLSACPIGAFLMLRRMSLAGDAMAHAILPGVAVGFLVFGLEIVPMTIGGLVAGAVVAAGAGAVSRFTSQREDASMAAFYLISLAFGVLIVSLRGSPIDLMHVLFGSVLSLNDQALTLLSINLAATGILLVVFWRALIAECLDPSFLRSVSRIGPVAHFVFLGLVVLNLVGGFQALGTLLSVGLMILPAAAARFWTNRLPAMIAISMLIGVVSGVAGLLMSYHAALPSGPSIVLAAGGLYLVSLAVAPRGVLVSRVRPHRHRTA